MPEPGRAVMATRAGVVCGLVDLLGGDKVVSDPTDVRVYETDGLTA